jgi:hypothetical protein
VDWTVGLGKRLIQLLYAYKYADHDFGPDPLSFLCPRKSCPNGVMVGRGLNLEFGGAKNKK